MVKRNTVSKVFNFDFLPDEILARIFRFLRHEELCKIGRVCKRWHEVSRCPLLWKRVDVKFLEHHGLFCKVATEFVEKLPSSTTHLKLDLALCQSLLMRLSFKELSLKLHEKCPNIHTLVLHRAQLAECLPAVIYLCAQFLENMRVLVLNECAFASINTKRKDALVSKIEILDVRGSSSVCFDKYLYSKMPCLKRLHLAYTSVYDCCFKHHSYFFKSLEILDLGHTLTGSPTFKTIQNHSQHLTELYLCGMDLEDQDFRFGDSVTVFPQLKIACLGCCVKLTHKGAISFLLSCPSLQHIYVWYLINDTSPRMNPVSHLYDHFRDYRTKITKNTHACHHFDGVNYLLM